MSELIMMLVSHWIGKRKKVFSWWNQRPRLEILEANNDIGSCHNRCLKLLFITGDYHQTQVLYVAFIGRTFIDNSEKCDVKVCDRLSTDNHVPNSSPSTGFSACFTLLTEYPIVFLSKHKNEHRSVAVSVAVSQFRDYKL